MNIEILDPKGWDSVESFNNLFITKSEFCNRAANSVLKTKIAKTRCEAMQNRQEAMQKLKKKTINEKNKEI